MALIRHHRFWLKWHLTVDGICPASDYSCPSRIDEKMQTNKCITRDGLRTRTEYGLFRNVTVPTNSPNRAAGVEEVSYLRVTYRYGYCGSGRCPPVTLNFNQLTSKVDRFMPLCRGPLVVTGIKISSIIFETIRWIHWKHYASACQSGLA